MGDDAADDSAEAGFSFLDVLDAMASHYGETVMELLKRWPWKLFCARWARLMDYLDAERAKQEERERKAKQAETHSAHQRLNPY